MGGIAPECSFAFGTPLSIVRVIAATLPSPHSHLPLVRSEPTDEPLPSLLWQPEHVAAGDLTVEDAIAQGDLVR